jgi:hypothetical protein
MPRGGHRANAGCKKGTLEREPRKELAPKSARLELAEWARAYTDLALQTLVDVCTDKRAPMAARVTAASVLLDRGHGKARQGVDMKQTGTVRVRVHFVRE